MAKPKSVVDRFHKLADIGCYCCMRLGWYRPADMHHILSGGRRIGDEATIPLCEYHHRSVVPNGWSRKEAKQAMGPSLADGSKPFHERWGTQLQILDRINDMVVL